MYNIIIICSVFVIGEMISYPIFYLLNRAMTKGGKGPGLKSVFKGVLERLFLFIGLINNIPTVLIVLGALKLGTRIREDEKDQRISNDYFLIGNLISFLIAIIYTFIVNYILAI